MPMDSSCSRGRVLVAEDEPSNSLLIEHALGLLGCEVVTVADGAQAYAAIQEQRFDIAVLDYHMPVMNGLVATRAIRAWFAAHGRPQMPIIACTASAMPDERKQCLAAGMNDVLTKPFMFADLQQMLDRWMAKPGSTAPP